jgi:hypothetical protein
MLQTAKGKRWTLKLVYNLLGDQKKRTHLDALHREYILNARRRGLTHSQLAEELNKEEIRRYNGRPWHKEAVARKWRAMIRQEPGLAEIKATNL